MKKVPLIIDSGEASPEGRHTTRRSFSKEFVAGIIAISCAPYGGAESAIGNDRFEINDTKGVFRRALFLPKAISNNGGTSGGRAKLAGTLSIFCNAVYSDDHSVFVEIRVKPDAESQKISMIIHTSDPRPVALLLREI